MDAVASPVHDLADDLAIACFRRDPFLASTRGVSGYDAGVPDVSAQAEADWRAYLVDVVQRADQLEQPDPGAESILLRAVRDTATRLLAVADGRTDRYTVTTLPFADGPSRLLTIAARTTITDPDSAQDYLQRCAAAGPYLHGCATRLRGDHAAGLVSVAPLVDSAIAQLDVGLAGSAEQTLLGHDDPPGWAGAGIWRERLARVVAEEIVPALAGYREVLAELRGAARPPEQAGLIHAPGGAAAYACAVRAGTTMAADADELHAFGLAAMTEIEADLAELGARALGAAAAAEVFQRLRATADPAPGEDVLARVRAAVARAEARRAEMFHPPLPDPCEVVPMPPHLAGSGAPPMYQPPTEDGRRAGAYLINAEQPSFSGTWALESVAFHEAVPGHHAQFGRLHKSAGLPMLLRRFGVVPHSEGWGLYAEGLADELGLYSDDVQRLGMLANRAWRAVRVVVDTGLHARGWSRRRALEFALAHTALAEPFMRAEIDRYVAMPGQALGYLVGYTELIRLREVVRQRQGADFDLRDFHSAVLDHGSLPLPVLAAAVTGAEPAGPSRPMTPLRTA